jgi:steroid 5-alpha reductase family enzyme
MITSPLAACAALCGLLIGGTWLLSVLTREYSWVDRVWSIAPPVYVAVFAGWTGFADPRLVLLTVLVAAWGARLTFNYARKGGYAPGGEDYRWAVLRERLGPVGFQLFNATFISPYQNFLILAMTLPVAVCAEAGGPLGPADVALAAAFLTLLAGETLADQQQWDFHRAKKARAARGLSEEKGFVDTGLWTWSRHPNFFCEVGQWWVLYAFSVAAGGPLFNWSVTGVILLTLLFHGSTAFTEAITASKYPRYAEYQRRVSRLLPWPPRAVPGPSTAAE